MRLLGKPIAILLLAIGLGCAGDVSVDYTAADPVADARAALAKGDFHLVSVRVGDSVVSPVDSAYQDAQINVQVGPSGGMRYLPLSADPDHPGVPSKAQMSYMRRFNSEMVRMVEENARPPRRS